MWTFSIRDDVSGNVATVNNAKELNVALSALAANAGYAKMLDGDGNEIATTEAGALSVSTDALILTEQVDGSALNTNLWTTTTSGMTVVQSGGVIALNAGSATTANAYAILQTVRSLPLYGTLPLVISVNAKSTFQPQANSTIEIGIGVVSGNSAPSDGVYFRWNTSGEFRSIINNGGETPSAALTAPVSNNMTLFQMVIVEDKAIFIVNDETVATIDVPVGLAYPTAGGRLPIFFRVYNGAGAPAQAPQFSIGQVTVTQQGMEQNKRWDQILASLGRGAYQSPVTTFGQTENNANSTVPATATLSNTTAGYATKGGKFLFAAPGAAETDYALFAYQVPANYQLYINSVNIYSGVTGLAIVTPTIFEWSLGLNGSAVSLATADSPPTSWAPRRVALGMQSWAAAAAIGTIGVPIALQFETPLVIEGGRYLHVILRIPNGAATPTMTFRGHINVNGYFE